MGVVDAVALAVGVELAALSEVGSVAGDAESGLLVVAGDAIEQAAAAGVLACQESPEPMR